MFLLFRGEIAVEFLGLVNAQTGVRDLAQASVRFFRMQSGCEAVGIRLRKHGHQDHFGGGKVLRDAPPEFGAYAEGEKPRTPSRILAHLGDLLDWALAMAKGQPSWKDSAPLPWEQGVGRFFEALARFDAFVASDEPLAVSPEKLFQGPIAGALTHVGQLAMLRRLSGHPMRGENYFVADIAVGRVGLEQAPPRREFD